ncbi:MAG: sulfite exporter TauE/SafE family protein [Candidatus Cyclobacteriaceae bacterium M2_1C_046]
MDTLEYFHTTGTEEYKIPRKFIINEVQEVSDTSREETHNLIGFYEYDNSVSSSENIYVPVVMEYQENQLLINSKPVESQKLGEPIYAFQIVADIKKDKVETRQNPQKDIYKKEVQLPSKLKARQDSLLTIRGRFPTKIDLKLDDVKKRVYQKGDSLILTLALLNDNNEYSGAHKELIIDLINQVDKRNLKRIRINKGQSLISINLVLDREGVFELSAIHPELYSGSLFLKVLPKYGRVIYHNNYNVRLTRYQQNINESLHILVLSQSREFKANGKDSAEVSLFLFDDNNRYPEGIRVNIIPSHGEIIPSEILLKEDYPGILKLVSKDQEDVTLQIVPTPNIDVKNKAKISFIPPVLYLESFAKEKIHLLEPTKINVTLFGEDSLPLNVNKPWRVRLSIIDGSGRINPADIIIGPDDFASEASFIPNSNGSYRFQASSSSLSPHVRVIDVEWPYGIIIASLMGGLIGGLISFYHSADKKKWRIFTGFFSGMVLYWSIILLGVNEINPDLIHSVYSVFIISLVGGFLGVGSFNLIINGLGVFSNKIQGQEQQ